MAAAINQLGAAAQEIARNAAQASHQASDARSLDDLLGLEGVTPELLARLWQIAKEKLRLWPFPH